MKKIMIALLVMSAGVASAQTKHQLPMLPYGTGDLAPVMSKETVEFHHGKHVQAYVDNLNELIPGTPFAHATLEEITRNATGGIFNNGAQIYNHIIFFNSLAPEARAQHTPSGELLVAISRDFGSFENFKEEFDKKAGEVFGSGWTWLVADVSGKLLIISTDDAGNPLRDQYLPLYGVDLWEHSYYIDYRNDKTRYLNNIWRIVDWNVIDNRYAENRKAQVI